MSLSGVGPEIQHEIDGSHVCATERARFSLEAWKVAEQVTADVFGTPGKLVLNEAQATLKPPSTAAGRLHSTQVEKSRLDQAILY